METPLVSVIISAENELTYMEECERILIGFGIPYESRVLSLAQGPDKAIEWAKNSQNRGLQVIIVGSGLASPLAGLLASLTLLPIIAVPLPVSSMHGLDALLSLAQSAMGSPVATTALGKPGAANAGLLAAQILALKYPHLVDLLRSFRAGLAQQTEAKDAALLQDRMRRMGGP